MDWRLVFWRLADLLLVTGDWRLATGYWLLVTRYLIVRPMLAREKLRWPPLNTNSFRSSKVSNRRMSPRIARRWPSDSEMPNPRS